MSHQKHKILVAPLNWGLGHASRCIPIIEALLNENFIPILASDGEALKLLCSEFPSLDYYKLPSYNVKYSTLGYQKAKLIKSLPRFYKTATQEKHYLDKIVESEGLSGIISDNRFGIYSKKIPSVYITHQLNVLSGITTYISTKMHRQIAKKFDEIWVPDTAKHDYAGLLSQSDLSVKYLGNLSRLHKIDSKLKYDLTVMLSGPEPQREIIEKLLLSQLQNFNGRILFIRGTFKSSTIEIKQRNICVKDVLSGVELNTAINESNLILSRSGYSTIMDLAKLNKKTFFIPTPGQYEQEYLAKLHESTNVAPYEKQNSFRIEDLNRVDNYTGFQERTYRNINSKLFELFQRKGKS